MANLNVQLQPNAGNGAQIFHRDPLDPVPPGEWLRKLHYYLLNENNIVAHVLTKLHQKSGIAKSLLLNFMVGAVLQVFLFGSDSVQCFVSSIFVLPYAFFGTVTHLLDTKASIDLHDDECVKWLLFWATYATFKFSDFLSWMPFYWLFKTAFLLALVLPPVNLSGKWYREWICPLNYLAEGNFDRQVFAEANGHLLSALGIDQRYVKTEDQYIVEKQLAQLDLPTVMKQVKWNMPVILHILYLVFGAKLLR